MRRLTLVTCALWCLVGIGCGSSGDEELVDSYVATDAVAEDSADMGGTDVPLTDQVTPVDLDATSDSLPDAEIQALDEVEEDDTFDLQVMLVPSSDEDFVPDYDTVSIFLMTEGDFCATFNPVGEMGVPASASLSITNLGMAVEFHDLDKNKNYSVVVRVMQSDAGESKVVAWACVGAVAWEEGSESDTVVVEALLQLLQLDPTGLFSFTEEFALDLTAIVPELNTPANLVFEELTSPGVAVLDVLRSAVLAQAPETTTDEDALAFEGELSAALSQVLLGEEPSGCLASLDSASLANLDSASLMEAVSNLRLEGELAVTQQDALCVSGDATLVTLTLSWDSPCDGDAGSVEWSFDLSQLDEYGFSGPISHQWLGCYMWPDSLVLQPHSMQVNMGSLYVLFLESVVVPEVTGLPDMESYLASRIDCEVLASHMSLTVLQGVGLTAESFVSLCLQAEDGSLSPLQALLSTLSVPLGLTLQGEATLGELSGSQEDGDLLVDTLEDGKWYGEQTLDGESVGEFSGTFWGTRIEPPVN